MLRKSFLTLLPKNTRKTATVSGGGHRKCSGVFLLQWWRAAVPFALLTAALHAQTPAPNKAKALVDQAVKALGGDRFLNMHTRRTNARIYSFFHDRMSGYDIANIYVQYLDDKSVKGLQTREREVLGKHQDYSYLFLADQAFDITFRGARPIPDDRWASYSRSTRNDILYWLRYRYNEPGMQYDYIGNQVLITNHVEVVDITDASDQTIRVYFDYNSKLPVRQSFSWLDPETKEHNDEVTDFDKWRDAGDGIMWPFTIERQRNGYKIYQIFANKVEINAELPANIFDLPKGAEILKKVN
jgi:hypothetical protein